MQRQAIDRLLEILESARKRKYMYFQPVAPVTVIHWLHGLRTGFSFAGLEWSHEHRRVVVEGRGLEFRVGAWENEELERRGLTAEAVVDELIAIEIEMWQSQRADIAEQVAAADGGRDVG